MKKKRRLLPVLFGYFLLTLGVIGLILPIMPGWLFIIPGLVLLGEESKIRKWIDTRIPQRIKDLFDRRR